MNYEPAPLPQDPKQVIEYLSRELKRLAGTIRDDTPVVQYRTAPVNQGSLTAAVSANYKIAAGNIVRISSSATVTLTGLMGIGPNREVVLINVGTGVVVLKSEASESSASNRFALSTDWNLLRNAAAVLWSDPYSFRLRGISRT